MMSMDEAKGTVVASKKESRGCNNGDARVTLCDPLNIGTDVISTKETLGANVHHSFSTKRFHIGKHI